MTGRNFFSSTAVLVLLLLLVADALAYVPPASRMASQSMKMNPQEEQWTQLLDKVSKGATETVVKQQPEPSSPVFTIEIPDLINAQEVLRAAKMFISHLPLWEQIGLGITPIFFVSFLRFFSPLSCP